MYKIVDLSSIFAGDDNYRTHIDPAGVEELAESFVSVYKGSHGQRWLLSPITVAQVKVEGEPTRFRVVHGFRRFAAASYLAETKGDKHPWVLRVPVFIDLEPEKAKPGALLIEAFIENLQREDVPIMDEARGLRRILDETGMTVDRLANSLAKSKAWVSQRTQLLTLCTTVQKALADGRITFAHARELCRIKEHDAQERVLAMLLKHDWQVSDVKKCIAALDQMGTDALEVPTETAVDHDAVPTFEQYEAEEAKAARAASPAQESTEDTDNVVVLERSHAAPVSEDPSERLQAKWVELEDAIEGARLMARSADRVELKAFYAREAAYMKGAKNALAWIMGKAADIEFDEKQP